MKSERPPSKTIPILHRTVPQHLARRFAQICTAMLSEIPAPFLQPGWHFALLRQIRENPRQDRGWHAACHASDATSIGKALAFFEANGWIAHTVRPADRRAKEFAITEAGEALFQDLAPPVRAVARRILAPLTKAEATTLTTLLARLVDVHEAHAKPGVGRRKPRKTEKWSTP